MISFVCVSFVKRGQREMNFYEMILFRGKFIYFLMISSLIGDKNGLSRTEFPKELKKERFRRQNM